MVKIAQLHLWCMFLFLPLLPRGTSNVSAIAHITQRGRSYSVMCNMLVSPRKSFYVKDESGIYSTSVEEEKPAVVVGGKET